MKSLLNIRSTLFPAALMFALSPLLSANTVTLTSDNFSLGYGFYRDTTQDPIFSAWDTTETASVNTPTAQGDFSFTPTVSGGTFGSIGVSFLDRVLTDAGTQGSGQSNTFLASITASWTGSLPGDAELDPNYQVRLVITQISVYGAGISSQTTTDLAFTETTVGNTGTSPTIDVNLLETSPATEFRTASNWVHLNWNPTDFWEAGTESTRTFEMIATENRGLDGFEVFGYVELSYAAIPEPRTAAALFGIAALGALLVLRRRKWLLVVPAAAKK